MKQRRQSKRHCTKTNHCTYRYILDFCWQTYHCVVMGWALGLLEAYIQPMQGYSNSGASIFITVANSISYNAVGHKMMPLKLASVVFLSVELFHLRYIVFQFHRQRDCYPITRPRPCTSVQYLYVDRVFCRTHKTWSRVISAVNKSFNCLLLFF